LNLCIHEDGNATGLAFLFEHPQDVAGRAITEQLSQSLFVVGNAMLLHQREEIGWRVTSQGGLGKMRIGREEVVRLAADVREIAAAAAGDENLFAQTVGVFENRDPMLALAGLDGAHQARCPAAENECVETMSHGVNSLPQRLKPQFIGNPYGAAKSRALSRREIKLPLELISPRKESFYQQG
jgi:hypothetical protein